MNITSFAIELNNEKRPPVLMHYINPYSHEEINTPIFAWKGILFIHNFYYIIMVVSILYQYGFVSIT